MTRPGQMNRSDLRTEPQRRRTMPSAPLACAMVCAVVAAMPVHAQDEARAPNISTTLDTSLTLLDTQRGDGLPEGTDLIVEVRPGLRYASRAGRLRGSASYGMGLVHHTRGSASSEVQHQLSAALTGEVIEKRAFIDVAASVAKRSLSAYGQQSINGNRADNSNLSEVGTLSITPYASGGIGDIAVYDLRLNASGTNARKSIEGDSTSTGGSVSLNSASRGAMVGWGLTASTTTTDYRATGESRSDRAIASLSIAPDIDWAVSLRAGKESTDIGALQQESYSTWGGTVRWQPSPRTLAEVNADQRFFGRAHAITLSHRWPLSSLRFTSARDVVTSSNPNGLGQPQTLYQLFFEQFASLEPDPGLREQLVLAFLGSQGQDPNTAVGGGFITAGASLQERNDISWGYSAKRLTLAWQAFANRSSLIGSTSVTPQGEAVRQRGYNTTLSYRLTPTASLGVNGARLMTKATALQAGNDLKSLSLMFSDRLGQRTTASLSARYSVFNAATNAYRESAVMASLAMIF